MTFTETEIRNEKISVDYNDEWNYFDDEKEVSVKFYGFENRLRKFFNLNDDYGNDWIDCYATIDPVNEYVTQIFMEFTSNCDEPDRELQLKITNKPEGKWLFDALIDSDKDFGGFIQFISEAKEIYKEEM